RVFAAVALRLDAGADQAGDLGASTVDGLLRLPAEDVATAGGIAEVLSEVRQHRLDNPRVAPRRRVVIQVNRQFDHPFDSRRRHNRRQTPSVTSSSTVAAGPVPLNRSASVTARKTSRILWWIAASGARTGQWAEIVQPSPAVASVHTVRWNGSSMASIKSARLTRSADRCSM